MVNTNELIIEKLKELIDKNGPDYLTDNPLTVYRELVEIDPDNIVRAGAILMLLATGIWDCVKCIDSQEEASKKIQKDCCFNKKMSDWLVNIIKSLYCKDNKKEWKNKQGEGISQFLEQMHTFRWEGCAIWDAGNGTVSCYYDADIELKPTKEAASNKALVRLLKKNPFMTVDAIYKFYDKELENYLNREFEEYCTCDDYYEPVVEDFEIEYYVEDWCKKNGFKIISCKGDGRDDGFEPKLTRRCY